MHSDNLKSVLTQVAYSYYEELLKTYDVRDAKKVTYNMVLEVLAPFIGTEKERFSYYSYLKELETEWLKIEKESIKFKDYEKQEESIDVLNALKILLPYAKEKDLENGE